MMRMCCDPSRRWCKQVCRCRREGDEMCRAMRRQLGEENSNLASVRKNKNEIGAGGAAPTGRAAGSKLQSSERPGCVDRGGPR
eukprot:6960992-Prymnesium_polylepis.1